MACATSSWSTALTPSSCGHRTCSHRPSLFWRLDSSSVAPVTHDAGSPTGYVFAGPRLSRASRLQGTHSRASGSMAAMRSSPETTSDVLFDDVGVLRDRDLWLELRAREPENSARGW